MKFSTIIIIGLLSHYVSYGIPNPTPFMQEYFEHQLQYNDTVVYYDQIQVKQKWNQYYEKQHKSFFPIQPQITMLEESMLLSFDTLSLFRGNKDKVSHPSSVEIYMQCIEDLNRYTKMQH